MASDPSTHYGVIIKPLITEKGTEQQETSNAYHFRVHPEANKIQIRQAIEGLFDVTVTRVNTQNRQGKRKRVGWRFGRTQDWKKAIVTLKEGDSIEFL
ncbi:MAG: 50S ribosomal protein L23 [Planctomycetota bacterium]